jgi:hypothetical protein
MPITLLDVLGRLGLDALLEAMAARRMANWPGACGIAPDELFSIEEWEQLLLQGGLASGGLRVTVNGFGVDLAALGIVDKGQLRPLALRKVVRQGASIIITDLQRHVPRLWALACDVERRLRDPVRIGAIGSFSKLPALKAHYDQEDLIQIQIAGAKQWRFFGDSIDCGVNDHPHSKPPAGVSATVTMRPGDLMFVPAGLHHQCEAEGFSLHVGLMIEHATGRDLLRHMFEENLSLNRPFRPALGSESLVEQADWFKQELISRLTETDVAAWLDAWNGSRSRVSRLSLVGDPPVDAPGAVATLVVTMAPQARAGQSWKAGGAEFKPGAGAVAILRTLETGPHPVADTLTAAAYEVGPDEARAGLDQLVARGIVQIEALRT